MAVEITVRGEAEGRFPAERAVVTLAAAVESADKQEAYDQASATQQAVTAELDELVAREAVSTWSSDQVSVASHRPWRDDGQRGAPVHTARVSIVAEFSDFDRLGGFLDYWGGRDGVEVSGIAWDLTERNRRLHEGDLRKAAVDNAVQRAQAYADALRRGRVVPTRIADPGLLDSGGPTPKVRSAMLEFSGDSGGLQLTPQPVVIWVAVDASFAAD